MSESAAKNMIDEYVSKSMWQQTVVNGFYYPFAKLMLDTLKEIIEDDSADVFEENDPENTTIKVEYLSFATRLAWQVSYTRRVWTKEDVSKLIKCAEIFLAAFEDPNEKTESDSKEQ